MSFGKRLAKRVFIVILALFGLSILSFIIARLLPGDPVKFALGPHTPENVVLRLKEEMHLDKPIHVQYFYWLRNALTGNLGVSLFTRRSVTYDIVKLLPVSLELILYSLFFFVIGSITLGVVAGRYANTWVDNLIRVFSYIGAAIPPFVVAIVGIFFFSYNVHILPVMGRISPGVTLPPTITGMITIDALLTGNFNALADSLWHLIMPSLSIIFLPTALEARITRSSVVENLNKEYIQSAVSYGLPERVIMMKYLLKPSIIPTVSDMALQIASMLSNLFVVESIFSIHGFAWYGMNAMLTKDLNAIIGVIMVTGVIYAIANIVVDIIVEWIDPRIRQTE